MTGPELSEATPEWMEHAVCAIEQVPVDVFFPTAGSDLPVAQRYCDRCPVRRACLQYALDNHEDFGVWGGVSERGRRPMRRTQRLNMRGTR